MAETTERTGTIELTARELELVVRGLNRLYSELAYTGVPEETRAIAALSRRLGREDPNHEVLTTNEDFIAHILSAHSMGSGAAEVHTDLSMIDTWNEIQEDPRSWHAQDHETYGPGHDSGWC